MKRSFTVRFPYCKIEHPKQEQPTHQKDESQHDSSRFLTSLQHLTNCNASDHDLTPYMNFTSSYDFKSKEIDHLIEYLYKDIETGAHVHILAHTYILLARMVAATRMKIMHCELSLLIHVSLCITSKLLLDEPWDNRYWAEMVHLPLHTFNKLETQFLLLLRHNLFISAEQLQRTEEFFNSMFIIPLD